MTLFLLPEPCEQISGLDSPCLHCVHYHGFTYFGLALVCPLHLEGCSWNDKSCPDFLCK